MARKRHNEDKAEAKAQKKALGERKEREDRNRVTDVIGGWGGESERALRKVAQRGGTRPFAVYVSQELCAGKIPNLGLYVVVKLFNVIQQAQQSGQQAVADAHTTRGTGKATLPAPNPEAFGDSGRSKGKSKSTADNSLGRAKPGTRLVIR